MPEKQARHAHTDVARAAEDFLAQQTIDADGRQQYGNCRKQTTEPTEHPFIRLHHFVVAFFGLGNQLLHGADATRVICCLNQKVEARVTLPTDSDS